jgi:DNA-binding NtrC family response regulator
VEEGKLREDLLYRLNVFPIHVPPLRQRREDIAIIAEHFLQAISRREGRVKQFAPEVIEAFRAHSWPGNVRELRNAVERAYVMATSSVVSDACLDVPAPPSAALPEDKEAQERPMLSLCVGESWSEIERQVVLATLEYFDGHQQRASHALGVSVKTLYNRLRDWSMLPHHAMRHRQPHSLGHQAAAR